MVIGMLGKLQPWHLVCWALLRTSLSLIWNTRKCSFGLVSTQVNITTPSYLKTNKHKPLMVANFESCIMWRNFFSTLLHFPLVIKLESFREILLSKFILLFHSIYQLYFYVYTRFYLYLFNHHYKQSNVQFLCSVNCKTCSVSILQGILTWTIEIVRRNELSLHEISLPSNYWSVSSF